MSIKRYVGAAVGGFLVVTVFSGAVAFAVEDGRKQQNTSINKLENNIKKIDNNEKLQERLNERLKSQKTKLNPAQKNRLQSTCKNAQGLLGPRHSKFKTNDKKRGDIYNGVVSKLTSLSKRLKERSLDTTELDAAITTLQGKITTFSADTAAYQEAIADLIEMDCAADPDAFKASLEVARSSLSTINGDSLGIRTHIKDVIRPILTDLRAQLATEKEVS